MVGISLCMIVRDEEKVIERCLDSVKDVVDEIIIVDTGSIDNTLEKVKKYKAKVYQFKWIDDFAAARNYAFSLASKDYILWMDADDYLLSEDKEKLKALKYKLDSSIDYVSMNYVLSADENNKPVYFFKRNRLVKREKNFKWLGRVHEYLQVDGTGVCTEIAVRHGKNKEYTNRNLMIYQKMLAENVEFSAREKYYYANELKDNGLYVQAIEMYIKFLNTNEGWIEDIKSACDKLSQCYQNINDKDNELKYSLESLKYDIPTSDICCRIGNIFLEKNNINVAVYWFNQALQNKPDDMNMNFNNKANYTWIPYIQLCVCYDRLGDYKKAYFYNEEAAKYVPDSPSVLYNRKYFESKKIKF